MEGFTYRGKHLSDFGCFYIPDASARGDMMGDYDAIYQEYESRDGGYVYGTRVKPRKFSLSCYYEDITRADKERILQWLDRRQSGELIFDNRSYCAYRVHPTAKIQMRDYLTQDSGTQKYSGTFTIEFTAFFPFARMLAKDLSETEDPYIEEETGILPAYMMPPSPTITDTSFLLYNCGTENANIRIRIAGDVGEGLTIHNAANNQTCKIIGLTTENTTKAGKWLEIDSETGRVQFGGAAGMKIDYQYHDDGYIQLAPCMPYKKSVTIGYSTGSRIITSSEGIFQEDMVGQYVYLNGAWRYIGRVDSETQAQINVDMTATGSEETAIVTMNRITLTGDSTFSLSKLEIEYTPYVR